MRHGQADGADAAVQVKQLLRAVKLRKLRGRAVERLTLGMVDLVKGGGRDGKRDAQDAVFNGGGAPQRRIGIPQDDIGLAGVVAELHTGQPGQMFPQGGDQLLRMRQELAVDDHNHHDLPRDGAHANKERAYQASVGALVVDRDAEGVDVAAQQACGHKGLAGLQQAVFTGDDLMAAAAENADCGSLPHV